jgi:hypothetical protein
MFALLMRLARWCVTPTPRLFGNARPARSVARRPQIARRASRPAELAVLGHRAGRRVGSAQATSSRPRRPRPVLAVPKRQAKPRRVWLEARSRPGNIIAMPVQPGYVEALAQAA